MNDQDKLARNRFVVLNLVRLAGLAAVLIGIAIGYGRIAAPEWLAWLLAGAGIAGFFWAPNFVGRDWRTPDA